MFWSCWFGSWSIRTSAISCRCSLSMAAAGVAKATVSNRTHRTNGAPDARIVPKLICLSLRGDDEVRAPVLRVRRIVVSGVEREFLAVTDGPQPVGRNAERHQVGSS